MHEPFRSNLLLCLTDHEKIYILGPLPSGENLSGLVDYHSRWIEVAVVRATTSKIIIQRLIPPFARYGIPKGLWIVTSPNFAAYEIEDYLKEMGVEHRHTTSLWPRANGEVERRKAIRAAHAEGKNWREELNKFLLPNRFTPYSTTGKSPAELLFGRVLNSKMLELMGIDDEEEDITDQKARDRDTQKKQATRTMLRKGSMQERETCERETGFFWSRRDKISYRHRMRRSHMR